MQKGYRTYDKSRRKRTHLQDNGRRQGSLPSAGGRSQRHDTGSREDAEDLAQETFVKAYFSLGKYRGESSISTWLYSIAWHLAVSSLRKRKWTVSRERFTERELQESSAWLESGEDREMKVMRERQYEAIERAVAALEPQDRFLISAFYEEGRSIAELEQITGMTQANVKVRLFRCRNRLARILKTDKDLEK